MITRLYRDQHVFVSYQNIRTSEHKTTTSLHPAFGLEAKQQGNIKIRSVDVGQTASRVP